MGGLAAALPHFGGDFIYFAKFDRKISADRASTK